MADQVYKVVLRLPLLARATSADELRRRLAGMGIEEVLFEINEGDMIGGTRSIEMIEHVPASEIEKELQAVGNDGTFFEDVDMGDGYDEGEGKDPD